VAASHLGQQSLSAQFSSQLASVKALEPGLDRAVQALQLTASLYGGSAGGQVLRVPMGNVGAVDRHTLGAYLAEISPGSAVTQSTLDMLQHGPGHVSEPIGDSDAEVHQRLVQGGSGKAWQSLASLRDLHAGE
jgi:hypothetical protein